MNNHTAKHLCYNMYVASYEPDYSSAGSIEEQMKAWGITYQHITYQPMADSVWFWNCKNVPESLPKYMSELKIDPMDAVGFGLSEEDALKIKNYE